MISHSFESNINAADLVTFLPYPPLLEHRGVPSAKAAEWHFGQNNNRSIDNYRSIRNMEFPQTSSPGVP
jgi:hypothetical protein